MTGVCPVCGIIGYIGRKPAASILVTGLKRMEYRGYDSAGIATIEPDGSVKVSKKQGLVANLEAEITTSIHNGTVGIGHTRWATHGAPTDTNAHPHTQGHVTIIHNGIFENYEFHKSKLGAYTFISETDSEVLAALIDSHYNTSGDPLHSVIDALGEVHGTYGLVVMFDDQPSTLVVARRSSPVLIAQEGDSIFVASDQQALAGRAAQAIVLNDNEVAFCKPGLVDINTLGQDPLPQDMVTLSMTNESSSKDGHAHFMLKEIYEQPESLSRVLSGRLNPARGSSQLGGINITPKQLRGIRSLLLVGCGTAYNAGLTAKYILEPLLKIPVTVEVASELRYRNVALTGNELAIAISQSGETADTIACIDELQLKGIPTLGVVNVVGSTIARMVDGGIYCHAGPEIAVASTKAYSSQLTALLLVGLYMARQRNLTIAEGEQFISDMQSLPELIKQTLLVNSDLKKAAKELVDSDFIMTLGRDTLYPVAIETALKIKEISYIPTYAEAGGEMKHGPIALIGTGTNVVYLLGQNELYDKSLSNLAEIRARGIQPLVLTDSPAYKEPAIHLPYHSKLLQPFVFAVAGQLLAYHTANKLKREIDKPRNLAKSVTVE